MVTHVRTVYDYRLVITLVGMNFWWSARACETFDRQTYVFPTRRCCVDRVSCLQFFALTQSSVFCHTIRKTKMWMTPLRPRSCVGNLLTVAAFCSVLSFALLIVFLELLDYSCVVVTAKRSFSVFMFFDDSSFRVWFAGCRGWYT